jgi:sphingolipid delta-4 desaturase
MMSKYPDVKHLNGPCPYNKYKASFVICVQLLAAVVLRDAPWPLLLLMTYTLSGSCNHFLTLAMHEVSHNLAFRSGPANRIFSIIVNLPLGIPAAM